MTNELIRIVGDDGGVRVEQPFPGFPNGFDAAAFGDALIVGANAGGAPHVKVYVAGQLTQSFYAFAQNFPGGARVGIDDNSIYVGAGPGGAPHVKVFDRNLNLKESFYVGDPANTHGVSIAIGGIQETAFNSNQQ